MTPETLRGWVGVDRGGTHWEGCWKSHKDCAIFAAADAWEAEHKIVLEQRDFIIEQSKRMEATKSHIEALEKALPWMQKALDLIGATLAAKEKPK